MTVTTTERAEIASSPARSRGTASLPETYLDDVTIPADRLVGQPGQGLRLALGTVDRTRTAVAAQAVAPI